MLIDDTGGKTIFPGFAAGLATLHGRRAVSVTCSISYFDTQTSVTTKLPVANGKAQYAPAIDEATGAFYFIETPEDKCGRNATLFTSTIGVDGRTLLAILPNGIDTGWTLALAPNAVSGLQDLYYQRWDCRRRTGDIFRFLSVDDPAPTSNAITHRQRGSGLASADDDARRPVVRA